MGNRTLSHLSGSYGYQPYNKLTGTATANYRYDNNGNMTARTDATGSTIFTWNVENQLTHVALPTGLTINYKYDALGRRIQRTTSAGANERYVYDGADVLLDLNADGSVATTYLSDLGTDNKLRQTSSSGISYYLSDHLGSTAGLTDASGNIIEQLAYDSFGDSIGSARTRYGYSGRERDPDTGQLYYRARFFEPQLGRFTAEDPIQFDGGLNWYAYVDNSPILFSDPTGLSKGDRWYGYRNRDFHKWFHRCWKKAGDPDADKETIEEAYREWVNRGSPKGGDCWGRKQPQPTECREPARNPNRMPSRIPIGYSQGELDSFAEAARQKHEFWKKFTLGGYLVGSVLTAGALSGGSAAAAPWLVPIFVP